MATESKRSRDPAKALIKPWKIKPERAANKSLAKRRQKNNNDTTKNAKENLYI